MSDDAKPGRVFLYVATPPADVDLRIDTTRLTGGNVPLEPNPDVIEIVVDSVAHGDPPPLEIGAVGAVDYVPPDGAALFQSEPVDMLVAPPSPGLFWPADTLRRYRALARAQQQRIMRAVCRLRSLHEIRARAATSRYWARRLRWLRRRGRA